PNRVIADATSKCATEANHRGLKLSTGYGEVTPGNFDPLHLERIVRNLLSCSMTRVSEGEIRVATRSNGSGFQIEVDDNGPALTDGELDTVANHHGSHPGATLIGLYIARAMAESSGGQLRIISSGTGVKFVAEIPSARNASRTAVSH